MEADERQEKSAQESEKSDRSNEPVAKMKEDVQREQKEEEQRRRKERLEEEEEKKRKEKLEESQRERKGKMEEAQKERQRLAEDVRLDWLDRRPAVEAMASTESTEDLRCKERRRKRREDSESRLLVTCNDNQDSQDPLERSDKTPGVYQQLLHQHFYNYGSFTHFIFSFYPFHIEMYLNRICTNNAFKIRGTVSVRLKLLGLGNMTSYHVK